MVRWLKDLLDPERKARRAHYQKWVNEYKLSKHGGLNESTGVWTCPSDGIYSFTTVITLPKKYKVNVWLSNLRLRKW